MAQNTPLTESVIQNAWLVCLNGETFLKEFSVTFLLESNMLRGVHEGDAFLIVDHVDNELKVVAFARVYRKRSTLRETVFFFDGFIKIEPNISLGVFGLSYLNLDNSISRLDWSAFENILNTVCSIENFREFPLLKGDNPKEMAYIRELLQMAVIDDLLGPANGPEEEIVQMSVRDRYLVGKLAPLETKVDQAANAVASRAEFNNATGRVDTEESEGDKDASSNQSLVPSSIGFTFCIDGEVKEFLLETSWGRYVREKSEIINERTEKPLKAWKRIPSGGAVSIIVQEGLISSLIPDDSCPEVIIQGTISPPLENGERLVTLFLINTQKKPEQNQDQAWIFQPEMLVRDLEGQAIFRKRPIFINEKSDNEREELEMVYRHYVEFAVGHGVSVHIVPDEATSEHAVEIRTCVVPNYEVPVTETPGLDSKDRPAMRLMVEQGFLDMEKLAQLSKEELISALNILIEDYCSWIKEQRERVDTTLHGYTHSAYEAMDKCEIILERLKEGARVLGSDKNALHAFRFANRAMALQRIHSLYALKKRRGEDVEIDELNKRTNRSWRPFQLAFMLLSIPSLADPTHPDRTEPVEAYADLLWFPTGGGKTEAYLGVAAFAMAIRRRQGNLGGFDASRGLTVIMRYTLRLLTIQQFQRATTLICAMEVLRKREIKMWGLEPFTIGLWVGKRLTPNNTEESHAAVENEREGKRGRNSTPAQLTSCPWCGSEILPGQNVEVSKDFQRTFIYCGDKYGKCDFSKTKSKFMGIPVLVVDEEIYRNPPSMLIATVDKFALMAWKGEIRTLFGKATHQCSRHGLIWPESECTGNHRGKRTLPATKVQKISPIRPPDLIIQDEFHLISGPLGTMVGLYETAVDELSTWNLNNLKVRPKVIASTATVRKADVQINNVFLRQASVFPPNGLDVNDNFFSVQRSVNEKPGRRYIGICSPGNSRPAVLIRVYVAFLTAAQSLFNQFGQAADPFMTLVGYFNSLRELGGMRRLAEDDVQTRCYRVSMSNVARPGLSQRSVSVIDELTSRVQNKEIPKKLDQLEVKFKSSWAKGETRAIDIVLATNMLSVGVDVNRLGLMVVNGQPKSTAEYIQATSRVGRAFPGLVCSVLTWSRPRDLSHYETFEHYHATFYKHVEAQSVTPFAPRALDRGLTGAMVSMLRLGHESFNPNIGAQEMGTSTNQEGDCVKQVITDRAWNVTGIREAKDNTMIMVSERIDRWAAEAVKPGRRLGYETKSRQGDVAALLKKPGVTFWDKFTVPMSMREVEPGVRLIMDDSILSDPPSWEKRINEGSNLEAEDE